jgi:hypothetical protein
MQCGRSGGLDLANGFAMVAGGYLVAGLFKRLASGFLDF